MKLSPNTFLFLSALGFGLLWGVMASNDTLDALNKAQADGIYPDGRPLRLVYTGFKSLDGAITMLVVFFDILCSGENPGSRLLGIDLIGVVHCINVWNFVDARRRGVQTEWMRQ